MVLSLAPVAPVLLGVGLAQLALGLMGTLIPLLLLAAGVPAGLIGAVASAYYGGFLVGTLSMPRLVARLGHIRAFTLLAAASAITAAVLVFTTDPVAIAVTRCAMGFASSGLFLITESWLNDRADNTTRGRFFGLYMVVNWATSAAGPLLLSIAAPRAALFALVSAGFAAALVPLVLTEQANPVLREGPSLSVRALFAISPVGMVCSLAAGLLNSSYYSLAPVALGARGLDAAEISRFASIVLIAALLAQYPLGRLSDRIERRRLTLMMLTLAIAACLGMAFIAGSDPIVLAGFGCVVAGAMSPLYGLGAGQMNDRLGQGDYVAAAGGLLFIWSVGASVGPSLAGAIIGVIGPSGLFAYLIGTLAASACFVLLRLRTRADVPSADRGPFVPASALPPRLAPPGRET